MRLNRFQRGDDVGVVKIEGDLGLRGPFVERNLGGGKLRDEDGRRRRPVRAVGLVAEFVADRVEQAEVKEEVVEIARVGRIAVGDGERGFPGRDLNFDRHAGIFRVRRHGRYFAREVG